VTNRDDDRCMKKPARAKLAGGKTVYLVEELSDARLRCAELKSYIKDATDLIEKSDKRDEVFEIAAHLIHGIPDTLFKLEKGLDAAAMAAARFDYEEIKQTLKPEKADELEEMFEDVRLRMLQRRSQENSPMTPKQAAEQLIAIADETEATGSVPVAQVMTLLASIEEGSTTRTASDVKTSADAFRQWADAMRTNPKRDELAARLRHTIAAHLSPTSAQVAASIYQTANSREQVMKGFGKANPHMSQEALEKAADMWEKHKNVVKDKHAADEIAAKKQDVNDNTVGTAAPVAKFEEGKPADPTKGMSPEDAAEWKKNTEEHKDDFKTASSPTVFAHEVAMFAAAAHRLVQYWDDDIGSDGYPSYLPSFDEFTNDCMDWREAAAAAARAPKTAGIGQPVSKFEEGKPADPTKGMSPEDAAEWKKQTEANKDNFKAASTNGDKVECDGAKGCTERVAYIDRKGWVYCTKHGETLKNNGRPGVRKLTQPEIKKLEAGDTIRYASEEPVAKFEEGKPADPTKDMSPEDAAEWKKQNDEHKDNFKAASAWKK
jgi:hypothetical protein